MNSSIRRWLPRTILYPWGLWSIFAEGSHYLRRRFLVGILIWASWTRITQLVLYLLIGLPLTVFITIEILISANQRLMADQADYRLHSDWNEDSAVDTFDALGPISYRPPVVAPGSTEEYHRYLVELYSPVIYQRIGSQPAWDIPLLIDYDGNHNPRDNVENAKYIRKSHRVQSLTAGVYGELTAETEDSYYLTYSLYHIKDYDHPIRQAITRSTYHDNDNEGFHIRIDRQTMKITEVETWFHNRFLFFNLTGQSTGTEPVHGKIHTEDDTHLIIYVQHQGHGLRLAQLVDLPTLSKRIKILRYRGDRAEVPARGDASFQVDVTYELDNFDHWYSLASGPFDESNMFAEQIPLGKNPDGSQRVIGRFIAGRDYSDRIEGWARPKPMWSWDDVWDDIPIFSWHFFPSMSFQSHGGAELSHDYSYNRPCEKVFAESASQVSASLDKLHLTREGGDKWAKLNEGGWMPERKHYWTVIRRKFRGYINYVFRALG